jgi:light-independent protochlorophyllide reductase subunit B
MMPRAEVVAAVSGAAGPAPAGAAAGGVAAGDAPAEGVAAEGVAAEDAAVVWLAEAERELRKIPFFVRGKARRNTERFAAERGVAAISVDTLYEAKAHYAR